MQEHSVTLSPLWDFPAGSGIKKPSSNAGAVVGELSSLGPQDSQSHNQRSLCTTAETQHNQRRAESFFSMLCPLGPSIIIIIIYSTHLRHKFKALGTGDKMPSLTSKG